MQLFRRLMFTGLAVLLSAPLVFAQQRSKVELFPSETMFAVLTGINACGYDDGLSESDPVRKDVRTAVDQAVQQWPEADAAVRAMCAFYRDHKAADASRELSQYVSLAINLGPAPDFKPRIKEADLPPDAFNVLGFVPLVANFYKTARLHDIWQRVLPRYEEIMQQVHDPVANMILATDVYLRNPITGASDRHFIIFLAPMAAPGQINARNYGADYFLVASPDHGSLPLDQIRHTYLHFTLDTLAMKRPMAMKKLDPVLLAIQNAPLGDPYKRDASLLVTESLIRAIEARLIPGKNADPKREQQVAEDMAEGFTLTRYFYDALAKFESGSESLKDSFPDWLYYMDIPHERKVAEQTTFTTKSLAEVVQSKSPEKQGAAVREQSPIEAAEQKMRAGDLDSAEKMAQLIVQEKGTDSARAYLLLGQIATLHRDKDNAIKYFETTLRTAQDPRLIAWSHIYLGRIYDVDQERDMAVKHYQAALRSGDDSPQLKAAAERGLQSSYERRGSSDQEKP